MLVGRDREQTALRQTTAAARLGNAGALVVTGDAGTGKTSLLEHAVADADSCLILRACGIESERELPFAGLSQLLRPILGLSAHLPARQAAALHDALSMPAPATVAADPIRVEPGPRTMNPAGDRPAGPRRRDGRGDGEADPGPGDRFAIGAATLGVICRAAEERPVLVIVDDAHWWDDPSTEALVFAVRRLCADPVAVLIACRTDSEFLCRAAGVPRLELRGLDSAATAALAAATLAAAGTGWPVGPDLAATLHRLTGGNPLAIVELCRDPEALEQHSPTAPVPLPARAARPYLGEAAALDPPARTALLVAALDGGDLHTIAAACLALGTDPAHLAAGESTRLVRLSPHHLQFRHPLARSAVVEAAGPAERRAAHRSLAAVTDDPDRRAWHLAEAAIGPDAPVADQLCAAGERAAARGAYAVAATAFERAAALSPGCADRADRLLRAAESAWRAGRTERARRLVDSVHPDGLTPIRAMGIAAVATAIALDDGDPARVRDIVATALRTPPWPSLCGWDTPLPAASEQHPPFADRHHNGHNRSARTDSDGGRPSEPGAVTGAAAIRPRAGSAGRSHPGAETGTGAGEVVDAPIDAEGADAAVSVLGSAVLAGFYLLDAETEMRAALALERVLAWASPPTRVLGELAAGMARILAGRGGARQVRAALAELSPEWDRDPARLSWMALGPLFLRESSAGGDGRLLLRHVADRVRAQAAVGMLPLLLFLTGRDESTTDRWADAVATYTEGARLARETGRPLELAGNLAGLACVQARLGQLSQCAANVAAALEICEPRGVHVFRVWALQARGDAALAGDDPETARACWEELAALLRTLGVRDPDVDPAPDLVEVYVRLGRPEAAAPVADAFAASARAKGQPWSLARAERCAGLLAADPQMPAAFEAALAWHARTPDVFEQARTRLAYGARLRRARRRRDARIQLRTALTVFEQLGAEPWIRRCTTELHATGETVRPRANPATDRLTPQQRQVALSLAAGRTTRETAAALFLSPKTVEYHLRHVYMTLGISSRAELAAHLHPPPHAG
ncbi:AAA family ATPase [Nocardia huaxiensis]|uniref:AAA family ATPase n=1 Tax=Nocardia huaxiensis TaxID=2755382 RepID=A0A7D6VAT6_9NOCA|nr:LuxR family transcriptional regulator [Nocardia huaxiensis]QLY28397.1 AAA family ATPase [Nocardia huaxiensis]